MKQLRKEEMMPTSPLDRVALTGFKSISDLNLELGSINVLIGANGAGKTNFLSFFRMLSAIVEGRLQQYVASQGGANSLLFNGSKTTTEISAHLEFGENQYDLRLGSDTTDSMYFVDEAAYVWDKAKFDRPYKVWLGAGQRETELLGSTERVARYVREKVSSWRLYHFHDTSVSAGVKQLGSIDDNARLAEDANNLAAFLLLLKQKHLENYRQIVDVVRLAAPFFQDFELRPYPRNKEKIRLEWSQTESDNLLGPNDLSDGTLRFICLAVALLQPNPPTTFLIDEPELGLHPYAITLLVGLIRSISRRTQVVISTQSVPLVNLFEPEEVIVVERHDGSSVLTRLNVEQTSEWLDDYGLGDLWEKNVIGGRPTYA